MGQCRTEFVREDDGITKQKSGRGASLLPWKSRIIDMKRRVVQISKPGREPARKAKRYEEGGLMVRKKSFSQNWGRSRL
jgi:hypothetical protein